MMLKNKELPRRRQRAVPAGGATMLPIFAAKARNAEIWDVEGRRYIDFAAGLWPGCDPAVEKLHNLSEAARAILVESFCCNARFSFQLDALRNKIFIV